MSEANKVSTSNTELKQMLLDRWKIQDSNTKRIENLEAEQGRQGIMLGDHDKILHGDPRDIKDQGLVGMICDLVEMVDSIKSWIKPLVMALITWALLGGLDKLLQLYSKVEQLTN